MWAKSLRLHFRIDQDFISIKKSQIKQENSYDPIKQLIYK